MSSWPFGYPEEVWEEDPMTDNPTIPERGTILVDDLIDETRGPEEDPPVGGTTDDVDLPSS
ncbi:hypothetical protein EV643_104203 [Kribbella sp. VKM Ac-2527]|uniref:Uncharacterized protein n=1 Tax=Kribbella caucasensis TaxID=2512215 RepID=A0A4R6KIG1_9ACTN|nr:hypothetical protein EV643_104203 [Kribbella sp. VKM Ac-2527]